MILAALLLSLLALDEGEDLREAVRRGEIEKVRSLLDAGVPVDATNRYGATALFFAADKGNLAIVELLVARGAAVDVEDTFYGMTPVARAFDRKHEDVALFLLNRALATNKVDRESYDQALEGARELGFTKVVALLESTTPPAAGPAKAEDANLDVMRFVGKYRSEGGEIIAVERSGEGLALRGGEAVTPLEATKTREFKLAGGDDTIFFGGRAGMVEFAALTRAGESVYFGPMTDGEILGSDGKLSEASSDLPAEVKPAAPWPSFRGPNGSGIADSQRLPLEWDSAAKKNVRFATPVEGFSVSSPIIWGNRIFVLSAVSGASDRTFRTGLYGDVTPVDDVSEHRWLLYALDTKDGRVVWERELDRRVPGTKRHSKSSQANATPVTDGKRIATVLGSTGFLYCHDMEGNLLWKKEIGVLNSGWFYDPDYQWGHSSSPILYDGRVIVQADVHGSSFIAAYDLENGNEVWRTAREGEIPTFATPTIFRGPTGDELVTNGTRIRGYDPKTGALLWHLGPNSEIPVGSPVVTADLIYVTAGYPPVKPIYAIRPGSRGDLALADGVEKSEALAWSKSRGGTYIPSPLVYRGYFYTNENNGLLVCYDAATGELVYRARIGGTGGSYAASPIAADGRLYFTTEEGETFVVEAGPEYRLLAKNRVEGVVLSTPAAADGLLVIRTLERVYGIANP
ncbi:MAG TPA: PQQ-binding-like beta-propeller repeat protein [Vicinamibacteria bacterium]|nr:PQQ-binding-like beta-propeller repeat protein [Vicinamibacteria bacterium]